MTGRFGCVWQWTATGCSQTRHSCWWYHLPQRWNTCQSTIQIRFSRTMSCHCHRVSSPRWSTCILCVYNPQFLPKATFCNWCQNCTLCVCWTAQILTWKPWSRLCNDLNAQSLCSFRTFLVCPMSHRSTCGKFAPSDQMYSKQCQMLSWAISWPSSVCWIAQISDISTAGLFGAPSISGWSCGNVSVMFTLETAFVQHFKLSVDNFYFTKFRSRCAMKLRSSTAQIETAALRYC